MNKLLKSPKDNLEKYIINISGILHMAAIMSIPIAFVYHDAKTQTAPLYISLMLWVIMLIIACFCISGRDANVLHSAFEGVLHILLITSLYFFNGRPEYILFIIFLNLTYFSFVSSLKSAILLSLIQGVSHILGRALISGMNAPIFDIAVIGYMCCGVLGGLLGNLLRSFFEKSRQLEEAHLDTVKAFIEAIEAKDEYTCGHSIKVSQYSRKLARKIGLSDDEVTKIEKAALLHDIGKIGVSDSILNKKGPLTNEEFDEIKKHPGIGVNILKNIKDVTSILPYIRNHHERLDGRGYPDGLKGEDISLGARIICIADSYDAMTSNRPYRTALSKDEAVRRLVQGKGTQFSPELVDSFIEAINDSEEVHTYKAVHKFHPITTVKDRVLGLLKINSLSKKIIYGLIVINLIPVLMGIAYVANISASTIGNLDKDTRNQQVEAFYTKIDQKQKDMKKTLTDYSFWDDTYNRIGKKDTSWIQENITEWLPRNFGFDIALVSDSEGNILASHTSGEVDVKLLKYAYSMVFRKDPVSGICMINDKPYIVAASPITNDDNTVPPDGSIIVAQEINEEYLKDISMVEALNVNYLYNDKLFKPDQSLAAMPVIQETVKKILKDSGLSFPLYTHGKYKNYTLGLVPEKDILTGRQCGYFLVNYTNGSFEKSERTVTRAFILIAILSVILSASVIAYFYYIIYSPVEEIGKEIGDSLSLLIPLKKKRRNDEFDKIIDDINYLINNLKDKLSNKK
jgi:uncharacterized domain HDIG